MKIPTLLGGEMTQDPKPEPFLTTIKNALVLPGNYSVTEQIDDHLLTVTFQTIEELETFLQQRGSLEFERSK